mgnify:CR=1 FL=1
MLKVWGRASSVNVQKVMWAVAELGCPHERIDAGGAFGKLDTPEFGRLNPNRKIPTIEDGATVLWESNAIVRYLAAQYGAGSLWPESPAERSLADRWMDWQIAAINVDLGPVFLGLVRTPAEKRDAAAIEAAVDRLAAAWPILDDHLANRRFVAGNTLTMGDIPIGCAFWRYLNLDIRRPKLPNLQLWFQALKERDPFRRNVMLPLS